MAKKQGFPILSLILKFLFFWYLLVTIKNIDTYNLALAAVILVALLALSIHTHSCCKEKKK